MYLLDTDICITLLNGTSRPLAARLRVEDPAGLRLSAVTKAELFYGARRSSRVADNLRLLASFFVPFLSLPVDDRCADHCGAIRAELTAAGQLIGPDDLLIAATARAHDLTLITHNTRRVLPRGRPAAGRLDGGRVSVLRDLATARYYRFRHRLRPRYTPAVIARPAPFPGV